MLHVQDRPDVSRAVSGEALVGPAERVRREDDVVQLQNWIVGIGRLLLKDIEPGAGDSTFLKYFGQRLLVNDGSSSGIDQISCRLHERQAIGVDEVTRLGIQR